MNFYWGTKLWGLATKNDELVKLANLQLAVTKRTAYEYFWMLDGNKNRPAEMVKNKVAGIYFEQKVDYVRTLKGGEMALFNNPFLIVARLHTLADI